MFIERPKHLLLVLYHCFFNMGTVNFVALILFDAKNDITRYVLGNIFQEKGEEKPDDAEWDRGQIYNSSIKLVMSRCCLSRTHLNASA